MRKMNRSAFTLVELIVVITILAILATVAFISFGGQTQKAKNTKVVSDVGSILQKIGADTAGGKSLNKLIGSEPKLTLDNSHKINSGATLENTGTTSYSAGPINYIGLGIKQADFQFTNGEKDASGNDKKFDYVGAYVVNKDFVTYEVAGNIVDQAGNEKVVLKGTYYKVNTSTDSDGLISKYNDSATVAKDGDDVKLHP